MRKKIKEKADKAAKRYARKHDVFYTLGIDCEHEMIDAFIAGIEWYLRNQNKIGIEEALDVYYKRTNVDD